MTQFHLLVSESGSHSAEKWAVATARQIFPVEDAGFTGNKLIEARRKELALIELLEKHHEWHQSDEQEKLKNDPAHILTPLKTDAKAITSKIVGIMDGSPWQDHFSYPDVQAAVESVILSHTLTNRSVERSWHADRNEHCTYARKYRETR